MPELPEAERARLTLESLVGKTVESVEDHDTYVCRPHQPGEIGAGLAGHTIHAAHRRGKFLWVDTDDGPTLGLHLGMAGRLVVDAEPAANPVWDRFTITFTDGTRFALRDKRRLGRALLNPDFTHVGPDAATISRADFRDAIGSGRTAIKARLLNQHAISGVGNLLADETLWQARLAPDRSTADLSEAELDELRVKLRAAIRAAIANGGVHTGRFIPGRKQGICPRDGESLRRGTIGGRTTYWCPACQS